jgi:hypothetical protein
MDGPNSMRQTQTFPPPTKCSVQMQLSIISIFRMGCCVDWAISMFHQASERSLYGNPTTIGWQDTSASKRQWQCYRNISTSRNFDRRSESILGPALPALFTNQLLRNRACTPLFLLLIGHENPYQWTTCWASHPPSGEMIVFLWFLIVFLRWRFWSPARRASQQRPLPSSSLNDLGTFWNPTNHCLISGQSISQHILVEPLVTTGHQAHQIHGLPPPDKWPK